MLTPRYLAWVPYLFAISPVFGQPSSPSEQVVFHPPARHHAAHPVACRHPYAHDSKYQCGVIEVPLDYHNPSAGNGQLHYVRLPAEEGVRRGTIFVDPGFPSATVLELSSPMWLHMHGDVLHNRTGGEYDVVVWTARGKGARSHSLTIPGPVTCFANATERNQFYAYTATALGFEAGWDDNLEHWYPQGDEDIARWYAVQKEVVDYCLVVTDGSMLSYMGTAASARDLATMADEFDGPGSPINYWGIGHGSLIGSYLLKMFPDRAGRIILDSPMDPETYSGEDPYRTWRRDIQWANTTFARFAQSCTENHDRAGCRLASHPDPGDAERYWTAKSLDVATAIARVAFGGWKQRLTVESGNLQYRWLLSTIYEHDGLGNPHFAEHFTFINGLVRDLKYLTLDLMPIFCGDLNLEPHSETMLARGRKMPGDIILSQTDALILLQTAFPSLQYMCHLWPARAVERYSHLTTAEHKRPANPVLVLGSDFNPLSHPQYADSVLRALRGRNEEYHEDADIVLQAQFGISNFAHGRCVSDVISDYLRNGTMPARHRCYGNGIHDKPPAPKQEIEVSPYPVAVRQQAQWYPPVQSCKSTAEPFPTGWTTSEGHPVLFYVKALYHYSPVEPEDLELLEGDLVAIIAFKEDGWAIGEPVNEGRRQPGRYLLPSNFVCLL